jgi:hypothetical protein
MKEPQFLLDAARVLRYAELDERAGRYAAVVSGVPVDSATVKGLAIVETLLDGTIFLLHCNDEWETVAYSAHASADAAQAAALEAYPPAAQRWSNYRALTDDEEREIVSTRAFLREIAADG